jgi:hypothetical protein
MRDPGRRQVLVEYRVGALDRAESPVPGAEHGDPDELGDCGAGGGVDDGALGGLLLRGHGPHAQQHAVHAVAAAGRQLI